VTTGHHTKVQPYYNAAQND